MSNSNIKPCPCCGSTNIEEDSGMFFESHGHEHIDPFIQCLDCGLEMSIDTNSTEFPCSCHYDVHTICRERWNMRVSSEKN